MNKNKFSGFTKYVSVGNMQHDKNKFSLFIGCDDKPNNGCNHPGLRL